MLRDLLPWFPPDFAADPRIASAIDDDSEAVALSNDDVAWIELGWQDEMRDSRGRWTRFGGVGTAADVMSKNREGFSVSVKTGGEPVHGFMVAQTDHTHTYPASILDDHRALTRAIDDMLVKEKDAFRSGDTYLGGWVHDGKLWLEPSDNIASREQAVREGTKRNQIAIWDVDNGQEIDTGGTGGGRITEHANTQDAGQGAFGLLGQAGSRAPGDSFRPGGPDQAGIFAQLIELGWESWRTEPRDRHGRWTRVPGQGLFGGMFTLPGESRTGEGYAGQFSDRIILYWKHEHDPAAKQHLNRAGANYDGGDLAGAASELRSAATTTADAVDAGSYRRLADAIDTSAGADTAKLAAIQKLASQSATVVPKMLGGGAHENGWNGKTELLDDYTDPQELGELNWEGTLKLQTGVADAIRDAQDHPADPVPNPDAFAVVLHEMIHGVVPQGHNRQQADRAAYQNFAKAQIEEGFTELGTIHHAADYFRQIGMGSRVTDDKHPDGRPYTIPELADEINDPVKIASGTAWGHYSGQTKDAQDWVQQVAMEEGYGDLRPGTPGHIRVVQLTDQVNREGTADKVQTMALQMALSVVKDERLRGNPDFLASLMEDIGKDIESEWAKDQPQAAREAFLKARNRVRVRMVQAMREMAA